MAYIGQNADGNFTTSVSKDTFSGNDSTTAFTLSEAATTNTVDVFVENIRQEPTTAYTVDGTTLTFTAAPVTGTDNIYVVNRGPIQLSASHPAAQALTAHSATITTDLTVDTDTLFVDSTNNRVGIGTVSPDARMSIEQSGTGDFDSIILSRTTGNVGDAQSVVWQQNDLSNLKAASISGEVTSASAGALTFNTASGSTLSERMRIDSSGNVGVGTSSISGKLTLGGDDAFEAITLRDNTASANMFSITSAEYSGGGGNPNKFTAINSSDISFETGGSEAMRIDNSGKVGIGASSPARTLQVHTAGANSSYISVTNGNTGSTSSDGIVIGSAADSTAYFWNYENAAMAFATNSLERMRIASDVNTIGVGTANPTGNMAGVKGVAVEDTSAGYGFSSTSPSQKWLMWCNSSDEVEWYDVTGSRPELQLTAAGALINRTGSIGTISDERLKQDITPASSQWDDIKAVQVKNYRLIEDVETDGENAPTLLGVIAQELEASGMGGLVEEVGYTRPDENGDITTSTIKRKSVKQSILYMKAVKALQEAMERIETLETQNASLEARLTALEA